MLTANGYWLNLIEKMEGNSLINGPSPRCSIIIRSYNEERHIRRLLLGISQQTLQPCEVIIVDSGSSDATVEIARTFGARIIEIKSSDFTFGRALNIGCAAAIGDILVFASAHVYPTYSNWLEELVEPFADPRIVLSYGKQRGNAQSHFSERQIFEKWFPNVSASPQTGYFCNNANCAISRKAWLELPYDESLSGLEDLAWAKSAQMKGGLFAYQANAEIIHVHEEIWARVQNRYRREAMAMTHIDQRARFSIWDFIRLLVGNVWSDSRVALRDGRLMHEFKSIAAFRFNQMWGTYLGYNGPHDVTNELRNRFYFPLGSKDVVLPEAKLEDLRIDYDALEIKPEHLRQASAPLKIISSH